MWTPRTIHCTGNRRDDSSTANTSATVACRFTSSVGPSVVCTAAHVGSGGGPRGGAGAGPDGEAAEGGMTQVRITLRGDSGFSNDELMVWCEEEGIDYVLGLAKNDRLKRRIVSRMETVGQLQQASGKPVRQFSGTAQSDAQDLVVRAPGSGEGGAPAPGREPAVHRDFGPGPGMRWATIVRGDLLRAGRHGEPHQGTAVGPVCGPHVDPEAGGESTAFVFLGVRLPEAGDVATRGTGGNEVGAATELDPAGEFTEDRGPGPGHDAQDLAVVFRELSLCGAVADDSDASESPPASLLARTSSSEHARLGVHGTDSALESPLERKTSLVSAGGTSNVPEYRRFRDFVTVFESTRRFSNSYG